MTRKTSRRRFLKATAATGALAGVNVAVLAQDQARNEEVILLGGRTAGWLGYRLPGEAQAQMQSNPTLTLQAETTYTLMWRNVDGVGHNFAIQNSNGDNMAVLQPLAVQEDVFQQVNETDVNESVSLDVSDGNVTGVSTANETDNVTDDVTDGNQTTVAESELVEQTEIVSGEGTVQGVRFTATEEMTQYICLVHPNTMVGSVEVQTGDGGGMDNNSSG